MLLRSLLAAVALAWPIASAPGLTLSISDSAPNPGPADVYNFSGAANDAGNVNDGGAYPDGVANDAFTYVAGDRPHQGQTFTTGSHPKGYIIKAIWVRHTGYAQNTQPTFWHLNSGGTLTVRVTDPMLAGSDQFALHSETYTATGEEGWAGKSNSKNGSNAWLKFTFISPFVLLPDKTYGFDVSSSNLQAVFEWLGTSNSNAYIGGGAYHGNTVGASDRAMNGLAGDRVFLVELAEN